MQALEPADRTVTAVIVALMVVIFALDLMIPLGFVIWTLYALPLGLSRWSSSNNLTWLVAGACTALTILGYLYSPIEAPMEVALINRSLGVFMVWIVAFFLRFDTL